MKRNYSLLTENNTNSSKDSTQNVTPFTKLEEIYKLRRDYKESNQSINQVSILRLVETTLSTKVAEIINSLALRTFSEFCAFSPNGVDHLLDSLKNLILNRVGYLECEIYNAITVLSESSNKDTRSKLGYFIKQEQYPGGRIIDIESMVSKGLSHYNRATRCGAIEALPVVINIKYKFLEELAKKRIDIINTLSRFVQDPHPHVRKTSLLEIIKQFHQGNIPGVGLYQLCVKASKDESEPVRIAALDLMSILTEIYPENPVLISQFDEVEEIRLVDSSFVKVCDAVNDISFLVRQKAFEMLGRYKNVDSKFLLQTFSKQVMSHLKRNVTGKRSGKRGKENKSSLNQKESSEQNKKEKMAPGSDLNVNVESTEFRLLDSGAAGAFVHGLEDEFQEVRNAAISKQFLFKIIITA
ncbi:hypothetical protein BB559_001738 [Furculomyces boomerangus]|uniref:Condensin complex subunit 1 C-terminal domain-containing protein n=1 Tax=Furculomyces boomerangus TaxID=61424 RepID=A0A2T9Z0X6_9FUNG|nr:hypothetical protein BB559_001738 [Furculomyces boomerangus]